MQYYRVPTFSWDEPKVRTDDLKISVTGASTALWSGTKVYDWQVRGAGLPVFPFLAWDLEAWLNAEDSGDNDWKVRWWWDSPSPFLPSTFNVSDSRIFDPKLVIATQSTSGGTGSITFNFPYSANPGLLTTSYNGLDNNWIGYVGAGSAPPNSIVLDFANPQVGLSGWRGVTTDTAPWGCWNPGVLSYGDVRGFSRSVGQSTNPYSLEKRVSVWGERYNRDLTLPLVDAKQMYAFRRINQLFENSVVRRRSPNNLFENLSRATERNIPFYVWTQVGTTSTLTTATYQAQFEGRQARITDQAIVGEDSSKWDHQDDAQRLFNVGLRLVEPLEQTPASGTTIGA